MGNGYKPGWDKGYAKGYDEGREKAFRESFWTIIKYVFLDRIGKNKP